MAKPRMKFTEELGDKILEGLAAFKSLRAVCREDGMPDPATVLNWVEDYPDFGQQYTRTRARAYQMLGEEILEDAHGMGEDSAVSVARARLVVDTKKWMLSKMLPKVYGDKLGVEHGGNIGIQVVTGVPEEKNDGS